MLAKDTLVDGKYRILSEIGRGGMSVVYLAINEKVNKTWAVKEVRKDGKNDYNLVRQGLITEIETLKAVKHSKLPSIIDVIEDEDSFIIVMDYIEGRSMDKILSERGAQPEEYVKEWAKQLCDVLGYLHSRPTPIIYRDMKPSNIMLKPDGDVSIIDFGTAKKYEIEIGVTTGLGTAGYAAPEQYVSSGLGRTDARTDIYSLGMTLYCMLTNIDPQKTFVSDTSIRKINPAFSRGLDKIIVKCTQHDPNLRYQSCAELMYDLNNVDAMDKPYQRKRAIKLGTFITAAALSIVCAILGLVLNMASFSAVSYIAAGVFFVAAIVLFFLFKVPELICDMTGISARRSIESIRVQSSGNGSGALNSPKSKSPLSKIMTDSGNLRQEAGPASEQQQTGTSETSELIVPPQNTTQMKPSVTAADADTQNTHSSVQSTQQPAQDVVFEVIEEFSYTSSTEIIP